MDLRWRGQSPRPADRDRIPEYEHINTGWQLNDHSPIEYSFGDLDLFSAENMTSFTRTYTDKDRQTREDMPSVAEAWVENDILYVKVATQWPFHVLDCVAQTCSRTKKSVVILNEGHYSKHDEKLLNPSILSSVAAISALHTNKRVKIYSQEPTCKSRFTITRETLLDENQKPAAEKSIRDSGSGSLSAVQRRDDTADAGRTAASIPGQSIPLFDQNRRIT